MAEYIQWLRSRIGHQKVPLIFTCAIIRNETGQILWQQRSDFGWWGLPGGSIEMQENLSQCLIREVQEESGLLVKIDRLLGVYSSPDFDVTYPNGDQAQQITFTFTCTLVGGKLQTDNEETLALNWLDADSLPETGPWYAAMMADYRLNSPRVQFTHGDPGNGRTGLPFYQLIRRFIGKDAYIGVGAAAIVRNQDGHILLQHRSDTGLWGLPGGGLEIGERIDTTVKHEVREETGLEVVVERLLAVYSDDRFDVAYPNGDRVKVVAVIFECRSIGGTMQPDGKESLAVGFFAADALPPVAPHVQAILKDAFANHPAAIFN
jgi:ADP-ribose pyrophosphatase YjhB (NUDIX family)